jgi:hypothetical protein
MRVFATRPPRDWVMRCEDRRGPGPLVPIGTSSWLSRTRPEDEYSRLSPDVEMNDTRAADSRTDDHRADIDAQCRFRCASFAP